MPQRQPPFYIAKQGANLVALAVDPHGNLEIAPGGQTYATVAASQTKQQLGATGAIGDEITRVVIVPGTTSPGVVELYDSTGGTAIVLMTGGASSVAGLAPITVELGALSAAAGWLVTTGANVSVIAVGRFT